MHIILNFTAAVISDNGIGLIGLTRKIAKITGRLFQSTTLSANDYVATEGSSEHRTLSKVE